MVFLVEMIIKSSFFTKPFQLIKLSLHVKIKKTYMTYPSESFLEIFKIELNDNSLTMESEFKKHESWSSLLSLLLITELESKFDYLATVDDLRSSITIQDFFDRYMANV